MQTLPLIKDVPYLANLMTPYELIIAEVFNVTFKIEMLLLKHFKPV